MRIVPASTPIPAAAFVLSLLAAGCGSDPVQPVPDASFQVQALEGEGTIHFMTQNVTAWEAMDAHFEGVVTVDAQGCVRTTEEDAPTVIWPTGFTGEITSEGARIRNGSGSVVGELGGSFTFGGGLVPELLASLGFTDADRQLADSLCPGSYWIVAP